MGQEGQEGPVGARKGQESPGLTHFRQRNKLERAIWQFLIGFRVRKDIRIGLHQTFLDEWGLEGSSWLLGSFWVPLGPSWGDWILRQQPMRKFHISLIKTTGVVLISRLVVKAD